MTGPAGPVLVVLVAGTTTVDAVDVAVTDTVLKVEVLVTRTVEDVTVVSRLVDPPVVWVLVTGQTEVDVSILWRLVHICSSGIWNAYMTVVVSTTTAVVGTAALLEAVVAMDEDAAAVDKVDEASAVVEAESVKEMIVVDTAEVNVT